MAFGDPGTTILEDCKSKTIKPYRHTEVKQLINENLFLENQMEEIKLMAENEISEEMSINYILLKSYQNRNTRIMKAYSFKRLGFIYKSILSKEQINDFLSSEEEDILKKYNESLKSYFNNFNSLDFSNDEPPLNFFVQIITLSDCGVIIDEGSFIELKKDRIYFVRKSAITHLINNNLVKVI